MAEKLKLWFDAEADFLELRFSNEPGTMKSTAHDSVMERIDRRGAVIGFT